MAVANKQVDAATNNSEDLQRLETTAPKSRKQIRVIWTSPIIPLDPLVWRKDLDPAVKAKLYTFLMEYGRFGGSSDAKKATAREVLGNLVWSPFQPVVGPPAHRHPQARGGKSRCSRSRTTTNSSTPTRPRR